MIETCTLAAGCFWGVEEKFGKLKGIIKTRVGYTGGKLDNPTYQDVCSGYTGHVEAVEIIFDIDLISFEKLLKVFFKIHDPTKLDRQGLDIGAQYKSVIFYHNNEQKKTAQRLIKMYEEKALYDNPIVTRIRPAGEFYQAEEYHQKYYYKVKRKYFCYN